MRAAIARTDSTASDGHVDVAVLDLGRDDVRLFYGDGTGHLVAGTILSIPNVSDILSGDFDGDGVTDLVSSTFGRIDVVRGGTTMTLATRYRSLGFADVSAADVTRSRRPDIVAAAFSVLVLRNVSR